MLPCWDAKLNDAVLALLATRILALIVWNLDENTTICIVVDSWSSIIDFILKMILLVIWKWNDLLFCGLPALQLHRFSIIFGKRIHDITGRRKRKDIASLPGN